MPVPSVLTVTPFALTTPGTAVSFSATIDAAAGGVLVDISTIDVGNGLPTFSNVKVGGVAMALAPGCSIVRSTFNRVERYYKFAPATGTVTISFNLSVASRCVVAVLPIKDWDTSSEANAFGVVATATGGAGSNPSVVASAATGQLVLDAGGNAWQNTDTKTVGAAQTELYNAAVTTTGAGSPRGWGSSEPGAASVTMSWTNGGGNAGWAQLAIALKPAPGGGGIKSHAAVVAASRRRRVA